jgi:hypothetical protein
VVIIKLSRWITYMCNQSHAVNGTDQLASVRTYDEPVRFWFPPRTLCCSLVVRKEMMSSRSYPTVSAWPVVLLGTYLYSLHFQISRSPDGSFAQEYKMDRCTFSRNTNAVKLSKVWGKASSLNAQRLPTTKGKTTAAGNSNDKSNERTVPALSSSPADWSVGPRRSRDGCWGCRLSLVTVHSSLPHPTTSRKQCDERFRLPGHKVMFGYTKSFLDWSRLNWNKFYIN